MGFPRVGSGFPDSRIFLFLGEGKLNYWMKAIGLSGQNSFW